MIGDLPYAEMLGRLNASDVESRPVLRLGVLRNVVLEPIEPYLRYLALEMGLNAKVSFGGYDTVMQDAIGGAGGDDRLVQQSDVLLVFLTLDTVSWSLARRFAALQESDIREETDRIDRDVASILSALCARTNAMILWHGFESPSYPSFGIYDDQTGAGQSAAVQRLNHLLKARLARHPGAYFVDMDRCHARVGTRDFYDLRYWHIGRAPYGRAALAEIAREDFKYIRALKGASRKCLVLDCDNTLWGGIVGEDGPLGISVGRTHPGSAYFEFQQELVNLYHRGVLIALCSRNNQDDVWQVFDEHADMPLRRSHIAAAQINWDDKATNLRRIAADLRIGLDSLVFMDDNGAEVDLVRRVLPEVAAFHLPHDRAVENRSILVSCGLFDTLTLSAEDTTRGAMYAADAHRSRAALAATDLTEYYRSLEMVAEIRLADDRSMARIAQLTQKTNQFNLTTRRYVDADIRGLAESDDADVLSLRLRDKFGDAGIVGVCVLRYVAGTAVCDTFLLSCRVLGRGVEDVLLIQAERLARRRGCAAMQGEYRATPKNAQVAHFFENHGFQRVSSPDDEASVSRLDLSHDIPEEPAYFADVLSDVPVESREE